MPARRSSSSAPTATDPASWRVDLDEAVLEDLRRRLRDTRWPIGLRETDDYGGLPLGYLRELVQYWGDGFDWRAVERSINRFTHHRLVVDGVPVHFLRQPSPHVDAVPIVLLHGWPWTFWDWSKVIEPLADPVAHGGEAADAFDVTVPSLPGFGLSGPSGRSDMNFWRAADVLHTLMTRELGNHTYAAAGCDFGALVAGQLGHRHADRLLGVYLGHAIPLNLFQGDRPWDITGYTGGVELPSGLDANTRQRLLRHHERLVPHVAAHMLDGQELALGLNDSPVGMLAWVLRRYQTWADTRGGDLESVFPREHLLTNATMWWASGSIASSIQWYANTRRYPWAPSHDRLPVVQVPMGTTLLGGETAPGTTTAQRARALVDSPRLQHWFRPVHVGTHEHGGHFGPWENPDAVVADIRATFRPLRAPISERHDDE